MKWILWKIIPTQCTEHPGQILHTFMTSCTILGTAWLPGPTREENQREQILWQTCVVYIVQEHCFIVDMCFTPHKCVLYFLTIHVQCLVILYIMFSYYTVCVVCCLTNHIMWYYVSLNKLFSMQFYSINCVVCCLNEYILW